MFKFKKIIEDSLLFYDTLVRFFEMSIKNEIGYYWVRSYDNTEVHLIGINNYRNKRIYLNIKFDDLDVIELMDLIVNSFEQNSFKNPELKEIEKSEIGDTLGYWINLEDILTKFKKEFKRVKKNQFQLSINEKGLKLKELETKNIIIIEAKEKDYSVKTYDDERRWNSTKHKDLNKYLNELLQQSTEYEIKPILLLQVLKIFKDSKNINIICEYDSISFNDDGIPQTDMTLDKKHIISIKKPQKKMLISKISDIKGIIEIMDLIKKDKDASISLIISNVVGIKIDLGDVEIITATVSSISKDKMLIEAQKIELYKALNNLKTDLLHKKRMGVYINEEEQVDKLIKKVRKISDRYSFNMKEFGEIWEEYKQITDEINYKFESIKEKAIMPYLILL